MCRSPRISPSSTNLGSMLRGGFDFAGVFAQLGRNPGEAQLCVDLFLGFARDRFSRPSMRAKRVFVQRKAHLLRARAQGDVVFLAAGEILQRRAVALRGSARKIHLQTFEAELDAGLVGSFAEHLVHFGMRRQTCRARRPRPGPSPADPDRRRFPSAPQDSRRASPFRRPALALRYSVSSSAHALRELTAGSGPARWR